jgi:hypothetical protein
VEDYNKAIEYFQMRYRPKPTEMFRIFLQVARFLREFSDFETPNTPDFRHPPIMGNREVMSIGLIPELIELKMFWGEVVVDLSNDSNKRPY